MSFTLKKKLKYTVETNVNYKNTLISYYNAVTQPYSGEVGWMGGDCGICSIASFHMQLGFLFNCKYSEQITIIIIQEIRADPVV